ncbi:MAG: enoyl-CoA hydratase/isomerase family protein [Actinomycetota bacterium]|nr:enoyl-CoA hydratase/isomerase family protein [Actinomycetota bacterium]
MALETEIKKESIFVYFNDEKTSNSISANDWKELKKTIEKFELSKQKYLVLSEVNGNFSSGAQLAENINALMEDVNLAAKALWNCKKPVISIVDGICAGAGANMILLSDFIIATPETRYIEVFARRGLVVDFGGSWNLPRMIGLQKAKELMMTTNEIDGKTMDDLGMLYKLTDKDNLEAELNNLIKLLNDQSFISICMIKEQIKEGLDMSFAETLDLEGDNQNKRFIHSDAAEGMAAFIEKRKPNYKDSLDA